MSAISASRSDALTGKITDSAPTAWCSCFQFCTNSSVSRQLVLPVRNAFAAFLMQNQVFVSDLVNDCSQLALTYSVALPCYWRINNSLADANAVQSGQSSVSACVWTSVIYVQSDLLVVSLHLLCLACRVPAVLHALLTSGTQLSFPGLRTRNAAAYSFPKTAANVSNRTVK